MKELGRIVRVGFVDDVSFCTLTNGKQDLTNPLTRVFRRR